MSIRPSDVPVFILCGGRGKRLGETAKILPKPMIELGEEPLLVHLMRWYARFGFRRFVLCAGWRGEVIARYFRDLGVHGQDFTIDTRSHALSLHQTAAVPDWEITIAHTGVTTMTGARIARAAGRYLGGAEHLAVTYGDGLTDADLGDELAFHLAHGREATVLGVHPRSQFGRFELHEDSVLSFAEKPLSTADWINGGYFFFRREFLQRLGAEPDCVLEGAPIQGVVEAGQLRTFRHAGFWGCVDTMKDCEEMRDLWSSGVAPWRTDAP